MSTAPPTDPSPITAEPLAAAAPAPALPEPLRVLIPPRDAKESTRLVSLDAYRGFIMLAMVSGGFAFHAVAKNFPNSGLWQFLGYQFEHVSWAGCAFWDLIQPSFMFMVGVAMPYSHASRKAKAASLPPRPIGYAIAKWALVAGLCAYVLSKSVLSVGWQISLIVGIVSVALLWSRPIAGHVVARSLILIALGVFLSSNWSKQTNFSFVNVLAQIGLGYAFVYLLIGRGRLVQLGAATAIFVGYWLFFYLQPLPGSDFNYPKHGVTGPVQWDSGLFAHWNKNANAASAFDEKFLNLFPQPARVNPLTKEKMTKFEFNAGGYATLNFIPSMITMILGLLAGELLRSNDLDPLQKLLRLLFAGLICGLLGAVAGVEFCPIVKRIWTPSWALYSAGWTFAMLAGFYGIIDLLGFRRWALPLVIVGMNSIAVYIMAQLLKPWVRDTLKCHLGQNIFDQFGGPVYAPIAQSVAFLLVLWLVSAWMYRQKIFIRI